MVTARFFSGPHKTQPLLWEMTRLCTSITRPVLGRKKKKKCCINTVNGVDLATPAPPTPHSGGQVGIALINLYSGEWDRKMLNALDQCIRTLHSHTSCSLVLLPSLNHHGGNWKCSWQLMCRRELHLHFYTFLIFSPYEEKLVKRSKKKIQN